MSELLPYTLDNLAGAACRVLLAPMDETPPLPEAASSIFAQQEAEEYKPVSPWFDVGATAGPTTTSRDLKTQGYTIEQSLTPLLEEPTEIGYTVSVPFAELTGAVLAVLYQGTSVSATAKENEGKTHLIDLAANITKFGNVFNLEHYRIAFVLRRNISQGIVKEEAGKKRGRFLTFVGYDCSATTENTTASFAKGTLATMTMNFKLYPSSEVTTEGEEFGMWISESAGTFT
jgi:hypothetical protein